MRQYILSAVTVLAAVTVSLGITSCGLISHGGDSPGKGGSAVSADQPANNEVTRVAALLRVGIQQARQQHWSAASTTFQDVLAIDPKNVYAFYNLGVIAQTNKSDSSAINYYDQALAANAKYTPAMYNKAILLESAQPNQAISLYNKIISINPQASTAYLRLALLDAKMGKMSQAKAADQKAVAIDPSLGKYQLSGQG